MTYFVVVVVVFGRQSGGECCWGWYLALTGTFEVPRLELYQFYVT